MFPVASPVFSCCSAGGGHKSSARSKRPDQRVRVVEMFQENPEENMRKHQKTCKMSMFHDVPLALSQMSAKGQLCMVILTQYAPKDSENTPPMNHTQASLWIIQFCKSNGFKIHTRIQEQNAHFEFNRWEQRHGKKKLPIVVSKNQKRLSYFLRMIPTFTRYSMLVWHSF